GFKLKAPVAPLALRRGHAPFPTCKLPYGILDLTHLTASVLRKSVSNAPSIDPFERHRPAEIRVFPLHGSSTCDRTPGRDDCFPTPRATEFYIQGNSIHLHTHASRQRPRRNQFVPEKHTIAP